jgi:hypothetical protein
MTRGTQQGLRFRTRKLSPKQPLTVLREDQIESSEYKELLENQYKVETGVEKSEENVSLAIFNTRDLYSRDMVFFLPFLRAHSYLTSIYSRILGIPSSAGVSSSFRKR